MIRFLLVLFIFFLFGIRIVSPRKVLVVLRLGKINRILREWFNFKRPIIESTRLQSLALRNLDVQVEGITLDNVKTSIQLNVVFNVKEDNQSIIDSIFKMNEPITMITAMIEEQLRAKIFTFNHEEIFGKREEIWNEVKETLKIKLQEFGMILDSVQVKDIKLDAKVMDAMNGVVAADKFKQATIKQAEWEKESTILRAEADKQVKKLLWEWMAEQRKAIANWFKESIEEIKESDNKLHGQQILDFLLASSRIETLEKIWENNSKIVYINENLEGKMSSLVGSGVEAFKS